MPGLNAKCKILHAHKGQCDTRKKRERNVARNTKVKRKKKKSKKRKRKTPMSYSKRQTDDAQEEGLEWNSNEPSSSTGGFQGAVED